MGFDLFFVKQQNFLRLCAELELRITHVESFDIPKQVGDGISLIHNACLVAEYQGGIDGAELDLAPISDREIAKNGIAVLFHGTCGQEPASHHQLAFPG